MLPDVDDDQVAWTAARCHRLLRPISSRLAILRKNIDTSRAQREQAARKPIVSKVAPEPVPAGSRREWKRGDGNNDPDWMPSFDAPKTKPQKRYTAAKPARETFVEPIAQDASSAPGEILLPTPFINRTLRNIEESPHHASPRRLAVYNRRGRKPASLTGSNSLQDFNVKGFARDNLNQIHGAFKGLDEALAQTSKWAPKKSNDQRGPRSLLSTCLRQVPAYIQLEECWQEEEDDAEHDNEKEDVSARIYDELENLGTCPGRGWRHLGEVVRAHAIQMFADGLTEGVLPRKPGILYSAVKHYQEREAWDACQTFIRLWTRSLRTPIAPPSFDTDRAFDGGSCLDQPLRALHNYAAITHSWPLFLREVSFLLRAEIVPVEWTSVRQFQTIWQHIIQEISKSSASSASIYDFLQAVALKSAGLPTESSIFYFPGPDAGIVYETPAPSEVKPNVRKAMTTTIESSWKIIKVMAFVPSDQSVFLPRSHMAFNALKACSTAIQTELALQPKGRMSRDNPTSITTRSQRACLVLGGPILPHAYARYVSMAEPMTMPRFEDCIRATRRMAQPVDRRWQTLQMEALVKLTVGMTKTFGRVNEVDAFGCLKIFSQSLVGMSDNVEAKYADFLKRWSFDAAMQFSEDTGVCEHTAFATSLQPGFFTEESTSEDEEGNALASGAAVEESDSYLADSLEYRWEEGIEEYIRRTPANIRGKGLLLSKPVAQGPLAKPVARLQLNGADTTEASSPEESPDVVASHRASPEVVIARPSSATISASLQDSDEDSSRSSTPDLPELDSSPLMQRGYVEESFTSVSSMNDSPLPNPSRRSQRLSKRPRQETAQDTEEPRSEYAASPLRVKCQRGSTSSPENSRSIEGSLIDTDEEDLETSRTATWTTSRPVRAIRSTRSRTSTGRAVSHSSIIPSNKPSSGSTRFASTRHSSTYSEDSTDGEEHDEDELQVQPAKHRRMAELQGFGMRPSRRRTLRSERTRSRSARYALSSTGLEAESEDELGAA